jgi:hypothetical protein
MTRTERIRKLGNAIRAYRGVTNRVFSAGEHVSWQIAPDRRALMRVHKWLLALNLDFDTNIKIINGFKTFGEFDEWLNKLQNNEPETALQ